MKLKQALVVFKYSAYQMHEKGLRPPCISELYRINRERARFIKLCHDEHSSTIETIEKNLKELGVRGTIIDRNKLKPPIIHYDLVITVGGDGTVLRTSHMLDKTPLLGVNSYPSASTGFFCLAKKDNFKKIIEGILSDKIKPKLINRLHVKINGRVVKESVLNEVLFASAIVAETSKYMIAIGSKEEEHLSSGIWISSAAGSTAVIHSAGGKALPITSDKIQFVAREPYIKKKAKKLGLLKGFVKPPQSIKIISEISNGCIYIDGPKIAYDAPIGTEIEIGVSNKPLNLFI